MYYTAVVFTTNGVKPQGMCFYLHFKPDNNILFILDSQLKSPQSLDLK